MTSTVFSSARILGMVLATALLSPSTVDGQAIIEIGTGTLVNGDFAYPAPYGNQQNGARHQMLVLASELQAAGMSQGDISAFALNVAAEAGIPLEGFTVSIGATTTTEMTNAWIPGLLPVWGPTTFTEVNGWNTHTFDIPWAWDGVSNVVVQTCFYNQDNSNNAQFFQTTTSFNSTTVRNTPNPNVCTATTGTLVPYPQRPNLRFSWTPLDAPPVAGFQQSAGVTCTGAVQFTDASLFNPETWAWDFGDGSTDTVQNPLHIYTTDGTYTPVLIVTNTFGSDTISGAPVTVAVNGPTPVAACIPASTGTVAGFGIFSVNINGHLTNSGDAVSEGYVDRTCSLDTVSVGQLLEISVSTGTVTTHNVRAWIDWDNSGTFIGSELVLIANSVTSASASIPVPLYAVLDQPLRIRVMAEYDFSPVPEPCVDLQFGQAEDYGLVVLPNTDPPLAQFSAAPLITCDGAVQFTDASLNAPSSWAWDFGDTGTSVESAPQHTYAASGTYTVTLIVTNVYGADTLEQVDLVTVDLGAQLVPASCTPETQSHCCGFGITSVALAGITSSSVDGSEGYQDRSCGNTANVTEGLTYPVSIGTGGTSAHDIFLWIDLDNDGAFTATELVWSALNTQDPIATLTMPSGVVFGTPLRMRIMADVVGESADPCDLPLYGQAEDFSVIVAANPDPPVAAFTATPTNTCTGYVQFTDQSTNAPDTWSWTFGDGMTSDVASPLHLYTVPGTYSVSLTVTNANGTDTQSYTDLIQYTEPAYCDTLEMPGFQDVVNENCTGVLADDGGPNDPYTGGESGAFTIAPTSGDVVVLTFSVFEWGNNDQRWLAIYDGPDVNSPQIGTFFGNGLNQLPNNGVITSSGPNITLRQESNGGGPPGNNAGFLLNWNCSFTGITEVALDPIGNVWPVPATDHMTIAFGRNAEAGWKAVLRNALGAQVTSSSVASGAREHTLHTAGLSPGFYMLTVETPSGNWNRTIAIR
jgi:PKD repeat protein